MRGIQTQRALEVVVRLAPLFVAERDLPQMVVGTRCVRGLIGQPGEQRPRLGPPAQLLRQGRALVLLQGIRHRQAPHRSKRQQQPRPP